MTVALNGLALAPKSGPLNLSPVPLQHLVSPISGATELLPPLSGTAIRLALAAYVAARVPRTALLRKAKRRVSKSQKGPVIALIPGPFNGDTLLQTVDMMFYSNASGQTQSSAPSRETVMSELSLLIQSGLITVSRGMKKGWDIASMRLVCSLDEACADEFSRRIGAHLSEWLQA